MARKHKNLNTVEYKRYNEMLDYYTHKNRPKSGKEQYPEDERDDVLDFSDEYGM